MVWDFQSVNCHGESVCGDSVLCERTADDLLWVHSDGMGHGVKANVLSELTCEIVMSEWSGVDSIQKTMEMLALRLPICSVRGLGYSTFGLFDYDQLQGRVTGVVYDMPEVLLVRDGEACAWDNMELRSVRWKAEERHLRVGSFEVQPGDWLVSVSDGVTQSGMGRAEMPFGWGDWAYGEFVVGVVRSAGDRLTPEGLCDRVLNRALQNEGYYPHDDVSVLAIKF